MGQTLPLKAISEHLDRPVDRVEDRPVDRVIERLLAENSQLRDLVIQLTRIAMRNVVDRK